MLGPFYIENALHSGGALGWGLALVLLADATGGRVLGRLRGPARGVAPLVGWLAVSTAILGAALAGIWGPRGAWLVLAAWVAVAAPAVPAALRDWGRGAAAVWRATPLALRPGWLVLAGWLAFLLTPPVNDLDSLAYHLALPEHLLREGRFAATDVYSHWQIPLAAELPQSFVLLAGPDGAAKVTFFLLAVAGVLACADAIVPGLPAAAALLVALVALAQPSVMGVLVLPKNDAVAAGTLAAAAGLLVAAGGFGRGPRRPVPLLAGSLLAGAAVAVKYILAPLAVVLLVGVIAAAPHRERGRTAALVAGGALLPPLPWLLKAWLLFADPLPPMGALHLPGWFGIAWREAAVRAEFATYLQVTRPWSRLLHDWLGMALPVAWPVAGAWLVRWPGGTGMMAGAMALGSLLLAASMPGSIEHLQRFCLPAWTVLVLLGWTGALRWAGPRPARLGLRALLLAVGLAAAVRQGAYDWWPGRLLAEQARYHRGLVSASGFAEAATLSYGALLPRVRAAVAGTGRCLILVGEERSSGIPARVRTEVFGPPPIWRALAPGGGPDRIRVAFRQMNAGWLLYNEDQAQWNRFNEPGYAWDRRMLLAWADFARRNLVLVASSGRVTPRYGSGWLYRIEPRPGPARSRMLFLPGAEPATVFASLADAHHAWGDAVPRYRELCRVVPGVAAYERYLAGALLHAGRPAEARPLLARVTAEGYYDRTSPQDLAAARRGAGVE